VDKDCEQTGPERPETLAVHAGGRLEIPLNDASSPPLFQASSYAFADPEEVEAIYGGTRRGAIYGRYGGPNGRLLEAALAELEGAEASVGAASGMAAINAALGTNLAPGDAVVASRELYGGTLELLENDYQQRGIRVIYVDETDHAAVEAALAVNLPRVLYLEALTNPLVRVADLPALALLAREVGALTVVDATFATPVLVRPIEHGIDLVVHSVGKYLGGHGDVGAGILSGRRDLVERARAFLVRTGATLPHFEAWLALRGIRTLVLRMERHSANARAVATFLQTIDAVRAVYHPSLPAHPQHQLAARLYPRGTGGIVAFDLRGGPDAATAFLRGLRRIAIVHSLGEVATTISHSATSSHRRMPVAAREALGVSDGTLRLSVGIEHADDIIADLAGAFERAGLCAHGRG
jgi:cystathionine beta-lyase/cystathionine gamma-synthase